MSDEVKPNSLWKRYDGGIYVVTLVARSVEDSEDVIVYRRYCELNSPYYCTRLSEWKAEWDSNGRRFEPYVEY